LSLQDAGSIGEDGAIVPALQSTMTVTRLEFGTAGFTAPSRVKLGKAVRAYWKKKPR